MNWPAILTSSSDKQDTITHAEACLPLAVQSLCPICLSVIDATIDEDGGQVFMDKHCPQHGPCRELISTDVQFFNLIYSRDRALPRRQINALPGPQAACPNGCGICRDHQSAPMMVNIDLTNRCNLNCPICFANAAARGQVVELTIDQIRQMLDKACASSDVQPSCLQYSGGEPTIHPEFLQALREAKQRHFIQIQAASNGIEFAKNPHLAAQASQAGLNIVYLQFDGMDDQIYLRARGRPLVDLKYKAIENLYQAGIRTVLVPTIVKGLNDQELGKILRFAIDNIEKIAGISFQPVAFTGRIDYDQRIAQRFTLADLARELERQTGLVDMYRDWYPFSFVDPFSQLLESISGVPQVGLTCNAGCGVTTYLVIGENGREVLPIPAFVDVEPLMDRLASAAQRFKTRRFFRKLSVAQELRSLHRFYHEDRGPSGWTFDTLVTFMMDFVNFRRRFTDNETRRRLINQAPYQALLLASMHFQDAYNYQIDRVQRCVVHYAAPDGRIYPFCSYNSGPCHRNRVEKQFAIPLAQYQKESRVRVSARARSASIAAIGDSRPSGAVRTRQLESPAKRHP